MPHSTIFQLYRGGQIYWWRKPLTCPCLKSLTSFITMLYRIHLAMSVVQTHNVSGDCTGSCKSNYHAITTTAASICIIEHNKEHNIYNVGNLGPGLEQAHNVAGLYQLIGSHTPPPLSNCLLQCYTS